MELRGRSGGPSAGVNMPVKASLHMLTRTAVGGNAPGSGIASGQRGRSLPAAKLAWHLDAHQQKKKAVSLDSRMLSRGEITSGSHAHGNASASGSVGGSLGETTTSSAAIHNPFAF